MGPKEGLLNHLGLQLELLNSDVLLGLINQSHHGLDSVRWHNQHTLTMVQDQIRHPKGRRAWPALVPLFKE